MNLHVTGHNLEVTPALREYLTTKMQRLTRHFDHVIEIDAILSKEREQRKAEAIVRIPGLDAFAEARDPDMYAAIDALVDKLDRQILKRKEKELDARTAGSLKNPTAE